LDYLADRNDYASESWERFDPARSRDYDPSRILDHVSTEGVVFADVRWPKPLPLSRAHLEEALERRTGPAFVKLCALGYQNAVPAPQYGAVIKGDSQHATAEVVSYRLTFEKQEGEFRLVRFEHLNYGD
jgi:hypothetical protein